jgi:succinyl-CoA synthetase beta subunit
VAQLTEHLSKELLARFGVPVQVGILASTGDEAAAAAAELGAPVAVKAQVPAGGRGKAGGIRRAESPEEARAAFSAVTSVVFDGLTVSQARVERWEPCDSEYYVSVVVDSEQAQPVALFSAVGGIDVEAGAKIVRVPLREDGSLSAALFREVGYEAGIRADVLERVLSVVQALARAHGTLDAKLVEVNPLGVKADGRLVALDGRIIVDDHALYRHPEIHQFVTERQPRRQEDLVRERTKLEYVRLGGWLGLISGGAGMTMAAMDLIADLGGAPACFLDCSNNPTPEGYGAALDLLLGDPEVRAILISIFGGLTQMDRVAKALVKLLADRSPRKPITLRLMGTNAEAASAVLRAAGLKNHQTLEEAVAAAVASGGDPRGAAR